MLITPTGMGADDCADDLVWLGWDGSRRGPWKPSSEWHFHQALYRRGPSCNAVVHTHSTHATALACLRRPLPAFHYMVAVAGGDRRALRALPPVRHRGTVAGAWLRPCTSATPACWPPWPGGRRRARWSGR
jgi:ribulose-5-phosphate 4-epimerase/fuculose-1-phosphate aldolase